jgi:hypothetical protein
MTERHRAVEFRKFFNLISRSVPEHFGAPLAGSPPPVHVARHPDP